MRVSEKVEGERRLAAIMFTDMVGFTTLSQRDEALAIQFLQQWSLSYLNQCRGNLNPVFLVFFSG